METPTRAGGEARFTVYRHQLGYGLYPGRSFQGPLYPKAPKFAYTSVGNFLVNVGAPNPNLFGTSNQILCKNISDLLIKFIK